MPQIYIYGMPSTSEEIHWGRQQVLCLISNVADFFEEFYDGTKKKKLIWEAISQKMFKEGHTFTGVECDKKWRNLKATYVKVLQKQIQGRPGYRFEYFDVLHPILGKEINPLGMGMKTSVRTKGQMQQPNSLSLNLHGKYGGNSEYEEINVDEGFVWVHSSVNLLLDNVKDTFSIVSPATIQERWEEVSLELNNGGFNVSCLQCQRKWENLQDGYYYYQTKSQATGTSSHWPYFTKVKEVMIALHIPVTVQVDVETNERCTGRKELKSQGLKRIVSRKKPVDRKYHDMPAKSILSRINQLESYANISHRLEYVEGKVEEMQYNLEAFRQTNIILSQIVSELRRTNQMIEIENGCRFRNSHKQQQQAHGSGSPNPEIIIVEEQM
ncbi:uncharacterized protein [Palaemon carinicauda]|uniref:uncharacterized protein isoform X2 n=1 Tax=Palaemon carinicauda TaxID=392227 RepID=UPI0035B5FF23